MPFKKKIFLKRPELKRVLIDFFVDDKGKKRSKYNLAKNREFLRAIKCRSNRLSSGTISNYCVILKDVEPVGVINEEFLFKYHKEVTGRIPKDTTFIEFSKNKHKKGKGYKSTRAIYLDIAEKYLGVYPNFSFYEEDAIKEFLIMMLTEEVFNRALEEEG